MSIKLSTELIILLKFKKLKSLTLIFLEIFFAQAGTLFLPLDNLLCVRCSEVLPEFLHTTIVAFSI